MTSRLRLRPRASRTQFSQHGEPFFLTRKSSGLTFMTQAIVSASSVNNISVRVSPLHCSCATLRMDDLTRLSQDPRVSIRRAGPPDPDGACVVYWMQRAQRGVDNPALDVAVSAANALRAPVVVFLAPVPLHPNANLRHYRFLAEGIPDIAADLARRNIGFVLRRFPEHNLLRFCDEVKAAL